MYNIPLFDLNYGIEEENAVIKTLRSKWISSGPKCEELEKLFAQMIGVKYAVSVANCTDALHLACHSLGIKEGDEVICPSLTFVATVNAIRYQRARPVFCDIKGLEDLTIDPEKIEGLITDRTKAIIVMDYAGYPCNMDEIIYIAKKHSINIIEDSCHGPLSEFNGKCLGSFGDIGCFSFFSNKNISTAEGGILVTDDEEIYKKCKLLRSHGMTTMSYQRSLGHATEYDVVEIGYNYRFDDIRASLAIAQLKKLREDLLKRKKIRELYVKCLSDIEDIIIPFAEYDGFVSNYIMPLVLKDSTKDKRDLIRKYLHDNGIQTSVHYPAVHLFSVYKEFRRKLPITEYVADNELTIPMYSTLTDDQVIYICSILKEALEKYKNFL